MKGGVIVSDAGPIIALTQIGVLDVLPQMLQRVVIPPAVRRELVTVEPPAWIEQAELMPSLNQQVSTAGLGAGESEAIALAMAIGADGILIDDLAARHLAERLGLVVIGTLGVLVQAKADQLIPAVRPLVDALRGANFYMSEHLYQRLLSIVGEAE